MSALVRLRLSVRISYRGFARQYWVTVFVQLVLPFCSWSSSIVGSFAITLTSGYREHIRLVFWSVINIVLSYVDEVLLCLEIDDVVTSITFSAIPGFPRSDNFQGLSQVWGKSI
jgi:hypothetical protein